MYSPIREECAYIFFSSIWTNPRIIFLKGKREDDKVPFKPLIHGKQ